MSNKTQETILNQLATGQITPQQAAEELKQLETDKKKAGIHFAVSKKGGVSVYGLNRWPVTLYVQQWEALIEKLPELLDFIRENNEQLDRRDKTERTEPTDHAAE